MSDGVRRVLSVICCGVAAALTVQQGQALGMAVGVFLGLWLSGVVRTYADDTDDGR